MRIDRASWPFIGGAVAVAALCGLAAGPGWAAPGVVLAALFLFFFRDPHREVPMGPDLVVSPADGRVLVAGAPEAGVAPPGEWLQVSIFLSPLDVHINRVPIGGRVTRVEYRPGRALAAFKSQAATENERSEIWIDHGGRLVVARQVVGVLARRVVCRVEPEATVRTGERFGVMKFGSRMDVFVPPTAVVTVTPGQVVRGGETVIARL